MYESFFGLREKPFALTPNTEFLVQLAPYQACLNLLRVALDEGEVGTQVLWDHEADHDAVHRFAMNTGNGKGMETGHAGGAHAVRSRPEP